MTQQQAWPSTLIMRGYPLTAEEEETFITELSNLSEPEKPADPRTFTQKDGITLLMLCLHNGATIEQFQKLAPRVSPATLTEIYKTINTKLQEATSAWEHITKNPDSYETHAEAVYKLLPHVINALKNTPQAHQELLIQDFNQDIHKTTQEISLLENNNLQLFNEKEHHQILTALATTADTFWDNKHFLPSRVGNLSYNKLAFLLGEMTLD